MNPVATLVREFFDFHTNTEERLIEGLRRIRRLEKQMANIHDLVQAIQDKVSAQNSVIEGVQTLLASTSQALKEAQSQIASNGDVSLLTDIANGLDQHNAALAAAVAANTPAAADPQPTAPVEPVTTDTPLESNSGSSASDSSGATGATGGTDTSSQAPVDGSASAAPTDGSQNT